MPDWSAAHIILLALLGALYVLSCVRISLAMRRTRRSAVLWFLVTLLGTPIPAMVALWQDSVRELRRRRRGRGAATRRRTPQRCPHCGEQFSAGNGEAGGAPGTCPHCHMPIDKKGLA